MGCLTSRFPTVVEHLQSSQQEILAEVKKGKMTDQLDGQLKKLVQDHVASFTSA